MAKDNYKRLSPDDPDRIPAHPPVSSDFMSEEPSRFLLMTPAMSTIGAMLVFTVVAVVVVVILPPLTMQPPPSQNWAPITDQALRGRAVYLANGCVYCHSNYTRPQDVYFALYYTYPRASEPGDYWKGSPSPNVFGTARTGPDVSQEGGMHPPDWHQAHYWSPRATTPISIMPRFNWFSDQQLGDMVAYNETRGGKEGLLRLAAQVVGKKLMMVNQGKMDPLEAFPALVRQLMDNGSLRADGSPMEQSPWGMPWSMVWMVNSFERGYWLTPDPYPPTQQNLLRGKDLYLHRCSGCHGAAGMGEGPAAQFLQPDPFNFRSEEIRSPDASDGMMYHRILTGGKGTAMENFGTRLAVEDVWRLVLFVRTIQNGSLEQPLVTENMYTSWKPPDSLQKYIDDHPLTIAFDMAVFEPARKPFMSAARWIAPGLATEDEVLVGGKLPMTLERVSGLVQSEYFDLLESAWRETQERGGLLPPRDEVMSTIGLEWHTPS